VVSQASDLRSHFCVDRFENERWGRVDTTSRHQIVPDENSCAVTCLVECIVFEIACERSVRSENPDELQRTASPKPDHVVVISLRPVDPLVVALFRDLGSLIVRWHPVCTADIDRSPVDLEEESLARSAFERPLDQLDFSNPENSRLLMQ
jgi:hypothetical protein